MCKKVTAFMLLCMLIFTVLTSGGCKLNGNTVSVKADSIKAFNNTENEYRYLADRAALLVSENDGVGLYYDEKTGAVSFHDKYGGKTWNSLPSFINGFASAFSAKVYSDGTVYVLDSSAAAASDGSITYETEGNSIFVTYSMKYKEVFLSLPVTFTLNGAYIDVSTDISQCVLNENAMLLSVSVLPYLGAVRYDEADFDYESFGDYFLVPDGSGALLYTALEEDNTKELIFSVYGKDYYEESIPASLGAYGIKNTDSAIAATITEGEEISLIRAYRSNNDSEQINRIYPEFIITPSSAEEGKMICGESYDGKISVSYELLSGEQADYMGISFSVRQALIKADILSSVKADKEYPLFISVTGSVDGKKSSAVSSFLQTENLLSTLKGKGINHINLILEGIFSGGLKQKSASSVRVSSASGSSEELNSLLSYASSQQFRVFPAVNLFSAAGAVMSSKNIEGKKNSFVTENDLAPFVGAESFERTVFNSAAASYVISDFLNFSARNGFNALCVEDADKTSLLLEGFSYDKSDEVLSSNLSSLSVYHELMVSGSHLNILKNASFIKDMPMTSTVENSDCYTSVPFLQAVLHSSYIYSGKPVNTSEISRLELLKAVEYGALPYYTWVFSSSSDKFYELTLSEAVDFYLGAKEKLGDITALRMTEHFMYEDNVYCTGYEGGIRVYVNYNNYSVTIGEVSVMPYSYLRIG